MLLPSQLGTFVLESGILLVGDPGYGVMPADTCGEVQVHVSNAKLGVWRAFVLRADGGPLFGIRCAELVAHHIDHAPTPKDVWPEQASTFGVDSGQAGIFDIRTVERDELVPEGYFGTDAPLVHEKPWYSMCCKSTLTDLGAGVIPGGAVSSSGFGDGSYDCFLRRTSDGKAVGVRLRFLTAEELADFSALGGASER